MTTRSRQVQGATDTGERSSLSEDFRRPEVLVRRAGICKILSPSGCSTDLLFTMGTLASEGRRHGGDGDG